MAVLDKHKAVIFLLIFAIVLLAVYPVYGSPLEDKIREKEGELSEIEEKQEARRRELEEFENEEQRLMAQLEEVESELAAINEEINRLNNEIAQTEDNIETTEEELKEAEEKVEQRDELMGKRLRAIYEKGEAGYLEVLFNATSFADFLSRLNDLKMIADNDMDLLEKAHEEKMVVEEKKEELEEQHSHLQDLKLQADEQREELNTKKATYEEVYEELQQAIEAQEQAIADLEEQAEAVGEDIQHLQEQKRQQTQDLTPSGELLWPLPASTRITSGYGYRTHPISGERGVFHGGVDIGIPRNRWPDTGNPAYIVAADDGVVISSGRRSGYGNTVIIDHGQGLATLYAHAHSLMVSEGQHVSRGEEIAVVGSTGFSTAPHLHFEVRVNGERKNPMNYFQ